MKRALLALILLFAALPASAQTEHFIAVSWTYTQSADTAVGFNVYRGTLSGGPYTKQNTTLIPVTTLTYQDSNGTANTQYFYVVTAQDSNGFESVFSNQTSATFLASPAAPTNAAAVAH